MNFPTFNDEKNREMAETRLILRSDGFLSVLHILCRESCKATVRRACTNAFFGHGRQKFDKEGFTSF